MRIKLILVNHQVENQTNFLISIPFSVQSFGDLNEYLKEYFDLPDKAHLQFQLDGFNILHKESILCMLKELDTIKVTLVSQETLLQKRKGATLSSSSIKKLKKESFNENKLAEFINDMLQIQKNIELEQNKSSEEDSQLSCEEDEELQSLVKDKKKQLQKQSLNLKSKAVVNKKNDKDTKIIEVQKKINSPAQNQSKLKDLKSSSSSSDESSEESESEGETKNDINKRKGSISAKYQKVLEKEVSALKQQVDKNSLNKQKNPIQANFSKGETLKQLNEGQNAQIKVIQNKNQQQQQTGQAGNKVADNKGVQNQYARAQNTQQQQQIKPIINPNQIVNLQNNQAKITHKIVDLQKQIATTTEAIAVLEKPSLQGILNKKIARKISSSESSSSSSSDDENEPELANKQSKIQLSFQKQNQQQIKNINTSAVQAKQQEQAQQKNENKLSTPLSKQNMQIEEKPSSTQTTPLSKPTLQPLLKGPKQEHVLNLNIKSPLEIYEEKKILWKQISPFITKMEKKLKKQQDQLAQKQQNFANKTNNQSIVEQNVEQKENQTTQKADDSHKKNNHEHQLKEESQELPPFDLTGFDKINLKDIIDYEKCLQKNFFNENDQIYFKDVEFDEEALCPKLSEWKRGTVTQIINAKKVKVSVSVGGKMESSTFDTSVFKAVYLKTSVEQAQEKKEQVQLIQEEVKKDDTEKQQQNQQNDFRTINDKNIFVGRTVNYYYGDKNYFQDKYILEHSNRNQDHYMPLSLLLNFPKIKKEVSTVEDLVQKLQTFVKITNQVIQFELNADKTMIRKKQQKNFSKDRNQQKQNNQNNPNKNQKQNSNDNHKQNENNNKNKNQPNVPKLNQNLIKQIHNQKDQQTTQINSNLKDNQLADAQKQDLLKQKIESTNMQRENEEGEYDEDIKVESSKQNEDKTQQSQMEEEVGEQKTITQQIVQNVEQQMIKQINELSQQNH